MQLVSWYQRIVEKLLPGGTLRRHYYGLGLAGARVIRNEGWRSFFKKVWNRATLVIPTYKQLVYTLNCLKAISKSSHYNRESGTLEVLHIPYVPDEPTQGMLINSLKRNGVSVYIGKRYNLFSLIRSIEAQVKPHLIHLHWAHGFVLGKSRIRTIIRSLSFLSELLLLRLCRIKIVWTVHNMVSHESPYPCLELFVNRLIALFCDQLIVHSNSIKLQVQSKYRLPNSKPINVIYQMNYIDYYENSTGELDARKKLSLKPEDFVFLYFGMVRPYKGVNELVDCFNQLEINGETDNVKLLIVGKPLNQMIHDDLMNGCAMNRNIIPILKWIDDSEVPIYMNAANITVFPFESILNTASVVLAMSFSKPVIAPAMGSIPEILDSEGGFVYTVSGKEGLLDAMKQALRCKPAELRAMGDRNFERIKEFTPEFSGAKTRDVYRRCLEAQR